MLRIQKYSSAELTKDIKAGGSNEQKAVRYLIRHNELKVSTFITRQNGSREDAEDIFQEGLTALILNIRKGSFKGDSSIHTYLFAICKGIWFKRFRKYVRDREYQSNNSLEDRDDFTPEYNFMQIEQKELIVQLFELLKDKCKETLFMWGSSFSMTEIAEKMGFKNSQVAMNKKNKCLKELKNLMTNNTEVKQLINELS